MLMGTKERLKLEFDLLKLLIVVFVSAILSSVAYGFIHYDKLSLLRLMLVACGVFVLALILSFLLKKAFACLNQIEGLNDG
ncbi:hypothetical protein BN341_8200 [Helicobacter heilmannii ASB1.4]|nr:hypothetical protein BN341_8200 [Helicobacter heilmannii ASB1.4]